MHIPSQFKKTQEWNLNEQDKIQEKNKKKTKKVQVGRRILIVKKDDIKYDYILNKKEFMDFKDRHKGMSVDVKIGSPFFADDHAKELRINANGDGHF